MEKGNRIIIILSCTCCVALCAMVLALACGRKTMLQNFTPPPFEVNALSGTPQATDCLGWRELDTEAFCVGICAEVSIENDHVNVWLTNPEHNSVWIKLRILDNQGNTLGETGLITPGQYVQSVVLESVPAAGSSVALKVMAYEPETYHSAGSVSINTSIY